MGLTPVKKVKARKGGPKREQEVKGKLSAHPSQAAKSHIRRKTEEEAAREQIVTSYGVFQLCLERAKNLIKIHKAAHGSKARPEKYLADAHRAAIVLAVSALDAFVRTHVITRIRQLLAERSADLPQALTAKIKSFLKEDGLLEAARKDDLLDRVEKAFLSDFERKSFQGTKVIADCMRMVGHDDIFHEVAKAGGLNEDTLKDELDEFSQRRHLIAHKGDYDLNERPPKENIVTKRQAEDCIKLVTNIAKHIDELKTPK